MYCLETPGDGVGQTVFCSTVAACEDLPERVRTRLEKLRAAHSYEQLSASFQRFAGGTAKTLSRSHEPALYHLVDDGALYLAPHAISHVVDETGKEIRWIRTRRRARRAVHAAGVRPRARVGTAWRCCGVEQPADDACDARVVSTPSGTSGDACRDAYVAHDAHCRVRGGGGDEADATVSVTASAARAVATAALERSGSSADPKPRRPRTRSLPLRLMAARRTGFDESRRSAMPWNEGTLRRIPTYESSWTRRASWSASMACIHESNVATHITHARWRGPPRHRRDAALDSLD